MRTSFQNTIATHQFSLPLFCILAVITWFVFPAKDTGDLTVADYGLWHILPTAFQQRITGKILGLFMTSFIVYSMVEFSNAMVLLRVSSRMLSTTLVFIISFALCLHRIQPAHIIMLLILLSYFSIFSSHQNDSPALVFAGHFFMATASLVCPKILILNFLAILTHSYLRTNSIKGFFASILAILTPYWVFFALAVFNDRIDLFINFFDMGFEILKPDYSILSESQIIVGIYASILYISGIINYIMTKNSDKLRQRTIYNVIIAHGIATVVLALSLPTCYNAFLGLFIIDTSIIAGRFWVVSDNKFTHFYFVILTLFAALVLAITTNL